ncbi:MAG TPA: M20/M25/M40 family metallo-hydrolase [Acetobacteraceae bacterium]|jgi:acetylornithine deacetylase/succinyl-diaminopimelate desuccinylase-like protein|nr:M20/M25/M40 family metallo-hydrolase [Acetobacteraceae bacterium]
MSDALTALARDLVALDSRSFVSNLAVADRVEAALAGFEIEHLDYTDAAGVAKRALVAHRGPPGGLALSGHMDTVPETGWQVDPWSAHIEGDVLQGLGSTDMKGPLAACIVAATTLPAHVPATLLITTDEETTKQGAQLIAERSELARRAAPRGILVAEPTRMIPVRGHRSHILFTATAIGVQAHSSTGRGRNANWDLIPFLAEMRALHTRVREDPALRDDAYDPPFSDFNLVLDNHGAAVNVSVPKATARMKYRYSARIDPRVVADAVHDAAARVGVALTEAREGLPPELPESHALIRAAASVTGQSACTAPYGTDASQLQALAPCVVLGPGDIAVAHTPGEAVSLAALAQAVPLFQRLAIEIASSAGHL